jgi:hypothetical protein
MPEQQLTPATEDHDRERELLILLTSAHEGQPLWSIEDLGRELGVFDVIDTVNSLHRAGLINRTAEGFVFATRAAVRQSQIYGQTL